jgi:hypothetical protein
MNSAAMDNLSPGVTVEEVPPQERPFKRDSSAGASMGTSSPLVSRSDRMVSDAEVVQIGGWVHERHHAERVVAGARVRLQERAVEVMTDKLGRFRFRHVRRGALTLVVDAPGRKTVLRRIETSAARYDVEI